MKKRVLIIVIIACVVVAIVVAGFVIYRPRPLIAPPDTVVNGNGGYLKSDTVVLDVYYNGTDITDRIDIEQLVKILSGYECRRGSDPFPYPQADIVWKIELVQDFKPIHIILGKDSFRYEAVSSGIYWVIDPESLLGELNAVIPQS